MAEKRTCPICGKRKPERFCPAKGEKICAVCCGTEREVTIDCPTDCAYLAAAHRYEDEHPKPVAESEIPFPDIEVSRDLVHEQRPVISGLAYTILKYGAEQRSLADPDAMAALEALAETYRTLGSGIYYEKPPDAALPQGLYAALAKFLEDYKKQETERSGFPSLKNTEIFHLLVFLLRVGRSRSNGRPRSRRLLEFLRAQFPRSPELEREPPRIITP